MTQEEKQLLNGKIMDYKEKYEEKLSKAIALHNLASETSHDDIRMVLEELFDELKESEDERVRKALIHYFSEQDGILTAINGSVSVGDILAWLEKQGKKIDVIENFDTEFEKQVSHLIASIINKEYEYTSDFVKWTANVLLNYAKHELEKKDEHKCDCKYAGCHVNNVKRWCHKKQSEILYEKCNIKCSEYLKQGEQKPADKVKPKFKIGDVISDGKSRVEIIGINEQKYIVSNGEIDNDANVANWFIPFENQSEWKLIEQKSDENVESKFKIGDWVVYCNEVVVLITGIKDNGYIINKSGYIPFTCQGNMRLWTIQDAKDGDVLAYENDIVIFKENTYNPEDKSGCMFVYCSCNNFYEIGGINPIVYKPATKKQRDLLFQKMKEAGYEWDVDKKELKKIEQKDDGELTEFESALFSAFSYAWQEYLSGKEVNVAKWTREHSAELLEIAREQKPAWSEEDERNLEGIINEIEANKNNAPDYDLATYDRFLSWLKSLKDRVQPQLNQEWSEEEKARIDKIIDVLDWAEEKGHIHHSDWEDYVCYVKSLKPQNTWKPSDEQIQALLKLEEMHVLEHEKNQENAHLYMVIKSLKEQLLKLKEE